MRQGYTRMTTGPEPPSLQEFRLRRNYSRPQSASRWNSEQDSSRLWQKRKKHENACCKKEKHILVCWLRLVGSSHKKLKNFVQRRPWALASFDVFSMLHWSMFHTDRNIGWPCETCSTVLLFVPSSIWCWQRTFGRDWGPWSEATSSPWLVPAVSCGKIWKFCTSFLHTFLSFFTMFHNASCMPVVLDSKLVLFDPVCCSKHSCTCFVFLFQSQVKLRCSKTSCRKQRRGRRSCRQQSWLSWHESPAKNPPDIKILVHHSR